jgi:hypothetical protein
MEELGMAELQMAEWTGRQQRFSPLTTIPAFRHSSFSVLPF